MDFLPLDVTPSAIPDIDNRQRKSKREPWETAHSAVLDSPNNLQLWNELFKCLEEKWDKESLSEEQKKTVRSVVVSSYDTLLSRFPYLTEYWKMYLILQYKLSGVSASLQVLETAKEKNPQSVSLWIDYLNARLATSKDNDVQEIRQKFVQAAAAIGPSFNSDAFWNLYIDFERKNAKPGDKQLLHLYLKLIAIPLYQYAQYYNQFTEICKDYQVSEVITDATVLQQYLAQFQKEKVEDLSTVEQHQIIDTFAYSVFENTQKRVNAKWEYESLLTIQDFTVPELETEVQSDTWNKYLDFEIGEYDKNPTELQYQLVVSVFERALVPNALNASMWLKYAEFTETHPGHTDAASIYKRGLLFVPLAEPILREKFVSFLMKANKFDEATVFLLESAKQYSGSSTTLYAKTAYVHSLKQIMDLWKDNAPLSAEKALEDLVTGYFDRIDRYKKSTTAETEKDQETEKHTVKAEHSTALSKALNDHGICVVAVGYLRILADKLENATKIRSFYNKYHKNSMFGRSVQFWKFFVDFEGEKHKNLVNLSTVVDYIKTSTALPKKAVDSFIDMHYEITAANLRMAMALGQEYLDILVTRDAEKSVDLKANKSARVRLANNNHLIQKHEEQTKGGFLSDSEKQDLLMSMRLRQLAHPGIFVDYTPEITNSIMRGSPISLLDDDITIPPLPVTRAVDRASVPVNYPEE